MFTTLKTLAPTGIALFMLGICPAFASVIQADYKTTGDGLITLDTTTGDEWLDATVTLGESPDQALAANPGFELATLSQVTTLLEDAGIAAADINTGNYYTSDEAAQNQLSQLLHLTDFWVQYYGPGAAGWEYVGFGNVLSATGNGWSEESLDVRNPPLGTDGAYSSFIAFNNCLACSSSNNFDFLVKPAPSAAPEPVTNLLMACGLAALASFKRFRRQTITTSYESLRTYNKPMWSRPFRLP